MLDREQRLNEDITRSEAIEHYKSEDDLSAEKWPDGYQPSRSERDEQRRPREMFSMGNSYGNFAVAANRNQEMTLVVSENRRHNAETLDNDHKILSGERRRSTKDPLGRAYTNQFDPVNSAFAFQTKRLEPENRLLDRIKNYVEKKGQNTVENILPFFSLEKDKKKLQGLQDEVRRMKEERSEPGRLEQEEEDLTRTIAQKERMQAQFIRKIRMAITKASRLSGEEFPYVLTAVRWPEPPDTQDPDAADTPDTTDLPAEDLLTDGLLDAVQGKKKAIRVKKPQSGT